MENLFSTGKEEKWEDLGKGVQRLVTVHSKDLMQVKVRFEDNAVGEVHSHEHTQISYVSYGVFQYQIGGQKQLMKTGDSCIIPPNVKHGCICLEDGELVDTFTPAREDFL